MALVRRSTGQHPIFLGPMFLHGSNDFECNADFSCHLATLLRKTPSPPVFGVDDEAAMHGALTYAFKANKLHCLNHLKDNVSLYLQVTTILIDIFIRNFGVFKTRLN